MDGATALVVVTIRHDLESLQKGTVDEHWTDKTPVPLTFFGPLWPDGPPEWWPNVPTEVGSEREEPVRAEEGIISEEKKAGSGESRLLVEVSVGEFANENEVVKELVNLFAALNAYNIACGGSGLTIDDWEVIARVAAPRGGQ